jgi:hypothetical protein
MSQSFNIIFNSFQNVKLNQTCYEHKIDFIYIISHNRNVLLFMITYIHGIVVYTING